MMLSKEQQNQFAQQCIASAFFEDEKTLAAMRWLKKHDPDVLEHIIDTTFDEYDGDISSRTALTIRHRIQMEVYHRCLGEMDMDILEEVCHALAYIENGATSHVPFRRGQAILEYYELWKAQNPWAVRHG